MSDFDLKKGLTGKKKFYAKNREKFLVKIFDEVKPKMLENRALKIVKFRNTKVHNFSDF